MSMTPNEAARFLQLPKSPAVRMTYSEEEMQQARKDVAERCIEIVKRFFDAEDEKLEEIRREFAL